MANDFYQHSGHPGTRAPRSSALLRAEFAAIEDGFDKLPDVGTANLFAVSDGSALVGKTVAQAKVLLALDNVTNTADADKPISTLTQAALDLKADYSALPIITEAAKTILDDASVAAILATLGGAPLTSFSGGSGYRYVNGSLIQFGYLTTHATANTEKQHSFPIAFASTPIVVGIANSAYIPPDLRIYSPATGYFHTMSSGSGVGFCYIAIA